MSALREVPNYANTIGIDIKQRQASRLDPNVTGPSAVPLKQEIYRRGGLSSHASLAAAGANIAIGEAVELNQRLYSRRGAVSGRGSSPGVDAHFASNPIYCSAMAADITEMFARREKEALQLVKEGHSNTSSAQDASAIYRYFPYPSYLRYQPEINERMRMILIDWLIDVHLKFKLHPETMYLTVNLIDRYLSCICTRMDRTLFVRRLQLQLVGVCAMLIAAKYEEIWPPQLKECVRICAETYTRDEIVEMERHICSTLSFRFTVPTPFQFASRLWTVLEGDELFGWKAGTEEHGTQHALLCHATSFFMEHAMLDYEALQFSASQVAYASLFLAIAVLRLKLNISMKQPIWNEVLRHYSKTEVESFYPCAVQLMAYVNHVPTTKYQAVRRKYNNARCGEVSKMLMPNEVPTS